MADSDTIELGGNIELAGFKDLDPSQMVVLKKMVGSYAKSFSERCAKFERLSVVMKKVHSREKSEKYEIHAKVVDSGKPFSADVTDYNLFFALDAALKKVQHEIHHI